MYNFTDKEKSDEGLLGSPSSLFAIPEKGGFIEITISYPRTSHFVSLTSVKQKAMYSKIFRYIKESIIFTEIKDSDFVFEYSKSGHIHMHSYILLTADSVHCPIGIVADIVKVFLKYMPKKYDKYNDRHMFYKYIRYCSPPITVQYIFQDDIEGQSRWYAYMAKQQISKDTNQGEAK